MTKFSHRIGIGLLSFCLLSPLAMAESSQSKEDLPGKSKSLVKALRFVDEEKTEQVTRLTTAYLQQLRILLDQRTQMLAKEGKDEASEINTQTAAAYRVTRNSTVALRDAYVAQLNALMPPALVDRVKDGLTDDWLHVTRQKYDEMVPQLSYAQKAHIFGLLVEMRENAMMEIGTGAQEKWVGKYRGIINNYIAKQGYDFTALSDAYEAKVNEEKAAGIRK